MGAYTKDTHRYTVHTDGGEARPRPHRAQKLVDLMDGGGASASREAEKDNGRITHAKFSTERADGGAVAFAKERPTPRCHPSFTESTLPVSNRYTILSVSPEGEGATVAVVLSIPASCAEDGTAGKDHSSESTPTKVKVHLLLEHYTDLGLCIGEVSPDEADAILEAGKLCNAIRRGMTLLQYGDRSARKLAYRLTAKGIDRETAESAVAYLQKKGYIREDDTARLRAEQSVRKLWGPRRIREDLRAQGFSPEAVDEAMESLSEVDWGESCAAAIRKKYRSIPEERAERQKLIASIMRLGYDVDTVREAMRIILRE